MWLVHLELPVHTKWKERGRGFARINMVNVLLAPHSQELESKGDEAQRVEVAVFRQQRQSLLLGETEQSPVWFSSEKKKKIILLRAVCCCQQHLEC